MSGIFRPETGSKRLDFSGGGSGRKVEFLLGGALAIIILGALTLFFWQMFKGKGSNNPEEMRKYECVECGYQFEAKTLTDSGELKAPLPGEISEPPQKCPKCGGPAYPMVQCPECGKWYLPEKYKSEETRGVPAPGVKIPRMVCPNPECGADYIEAMMKKRHKQ